MKNNKIYASIIMSTYGKSDGLRNTLSAIALQRTTFPLEICIVDDCSDEDIGSVVRSILPNAKFKRLDKNHKFIYSKNVCLDMLSPEVNVVVPMASDIILINPDAIQNLCKNVKKNQVAFGEVLNFKVERDAYKYIDKYCNMVSKGWNSLVYKSLTNGHPSRRNVYAWTMFAAAIMREDIMDLGYRDNSCDAILWQKMMKKNFEGKLTTKCKAIHQYHEWVEQFCPIVDSCNFYCSRTFRSGRWKGPKITASKELDIVY